MTDQPNSVDDWLTNPAPPPKPVGGKPAQKKPAAKPKAAPKKPANSPSPLRPLDALAAELDAPPIAAEPRPRPDAGRDAPPPPQDDPRPPPPRGGKPARPHGEIWEGCPVKTLGVNNKLYYYLDVHSQMIHIGKHDRMAIMQLFGSRIPALCYNFPKMIKDEDGNLIRKPGQFEGDAATMAIIAACSEKNLFDPEGAVRGVGAWVDDDGKLIYHTGDGLIMGDARHDPMTHQGKIYPAYPAIPHPAPAEKLSDPVPDLLTTLATWQWARPDIDPMTVLGIVGVQMMGGALGWRPTSWFTGSRETGKSGLNKLLLHLHGDKGLIQSTNTTEGGLRSSIGQSSRPVAVDELEPGDEGSRKERDIINLARVASSGGQWLRGSADQKGAGGNIYSSFMFSSILIPGVMTAADVSRLIVLSLHAFPPDTPPPPQIRAETWRKRGAALKRILIDRWPSWAARLDLWRGAFDALGIRGRNADNWATVMAMAQMARSEALPSADEMAGWAAKVAAWITAEVAEIGSDADEVITHLMSQTIDPMRRGQQYTVALWLKAAGWRPGAGSRLFASESLDVDDHSKAANRILAQLGLRVLGTPMQPVLFVATKQVQGLKDLFARSQWAGGAWTQSLARIAGAKASTASRYLDGVQTRGTEVPFASIPGLLAMDGDVVPGAAPKPLPDDIEDFA